MLKIEHLAKRYANNRGLKDTNLTFREGEICGILGRNGSGKTTLLKLILGLIEKDSGEVLFQGRTIPEQYEHIAFISEEGSFLPYLTAEEYGKFLASYYPSFSISQYQKQLKAFDVTPNTCIEKLSKGQQLKVEISAGFAMQAKLIILDEPFTTLDVYAKEDTVQLIIQQLKDDVILLISTHNIEEIEPIVDRCIVLEDGSVKEDFMMDELNESGMDVRMLLEKYRPHPSSKGNS